VPTRRRSPSGSSHDRQRVESVYRSYAADPQKAAAWAADNPGNRAIREEVAGRIVPLVLAGGGPVLDAGCGTGWRLARLVAAGAAPGRLTGVDLLPQRAAAAAGRTPGATLHSADVRALPSTTRASSWSSCSPCSPRCATPATCDAPSPKPRG
jgi:SAM-dependent methyltransferase